MMFTRDIREHDVVWTTMVTALTVYRFQVTDYSTNIFDFFLGKQTPNHFYNAVNYNYWKVNQFEYHLKGGSNKTEP